MKNPPPDLIVYSQNLSIPEYILLFHHNKFPIFLFVYFPKKNCNFSVRFLKIFCSYAEPCEMEDGRKIASRKIMANSGNIVEKKYQKW